MNTITCTNSKCSERKSLCCGATSMKARGNKDFVFLCKRCGNKFEGGKCTAGKRLLSKCPSCSKKSYVTSVFGSICSNEKCFYKPDNRGSKFERGFMELAEGLGVKFIDVTND